MGSDGSSGSLPGPKIRTWGTRICYLSDVGHPPYGFRDDVTFYTAHGDVFGWVCAILALWIVGWALRAGFRRKVQIKVRS
jgi:hypothetical protein